MPAFVTPAVWRYHPPEPARVNAELVLGSGEKVLAGRRGERWLQKPSRGLAGAVPLDLLGTDLGAREVETELGRIEHGIPI